MDGNSSSSHEPSLAAAYWQYGVFGNVAWAIVLLGTWGEQLPPAPLIAWFGFNVFVTIMIWDAAGRYHGRPIWKGLARGAMLINAAILVVTGKHIGADFLTRLNSLEPGQSVAAQLLWDKDGPTLVRHETTYKPKPRNTKTAKESVRGPVYIVKRGDTVFTIAKRANLTPRQLALQNDLSSTNPIHVGQRLIVDGSLPVYTDADRRAIAGLQRISAETNAKLPIAINDQIMFVNSYVEPRRTLVYTYRFSGVARTATDRDRVMAALRTESLHDVQRFYCQSNDFQSVRQLAASIRFAYLDAAVNYLGSLEIQTKTCSRTTRL